LDNETSARTTADTTLQTNIDTELSRATAAESTLQTNLTNEASIRATTDSTFQTNIESESTARINAVNTVQTNLNTEAASRVSGDKKQCFMSIMEAEGILVSNTFPFCAGMGAPSSSNCGLPVPFDSKLVGISLAISSNSNNIDSSVSFTIEHYKTDGSKSAPFPSEPSFTLSNISINKQFNDITPNGSYNAGNYLIKCTNATNLTDSLTRFRVALYFQSTTELI